MSLHKDIILGEIAGKNAAIHAYDKILWMIRTGYLTLFYGAWAIVLKGIIAKWQIKASIYGGKITVDK